MVSFSGNTFAKAVPAIAPATVTANPTAIAVDTATGFTHALVIIQAGTFGASATMDFKLQASTAVGSGYADITGATFTQITASNDESCYIGAVRLDGRHARYLKVIGTYGGSGNAVVSSEVVFINPEDSALASAAFIV